MVITMNDVHTREQLLDKLQEGQNPPIVIFFCSDSRVDLNIFNANPGEMFGIENAGNIFGLGDESKSSLAYALSHFSVDDKLSILILGHTKCGAVTTACKLHGKDTSGLHTSLRNLIETIRPAVERASARPGSLVDNAIEENVKIQMMRVRDFILNEAKEIRAKDVHIYGAIYEISGRDDLLPNTWHIHVIRSGQKNPSAPLEELTLTPLDGSNTNALIRTVMKLGAYIRGELLPRSK